MDTIARFAPRGRYGQWYAYQSRNATGDGEERGIAERPENAMTEAGMTDRVDGGYVGRLAPAPTGALHLGNARTFLVAWLRERRAGGRLVLRLEDLDHPKVKPHAAREAYRDLHWLGLDWDAGPNESFPPWEGDVPESGAGENEGATLEREYVQSRRVEVYETVLRELWRRKLIYPCVCTRKELESVQSAPNAGEDMLERRYPGTCRGRFATPEEAKAAAGGREPGWRFVVNDGAAFSFVDGFFGEREGSLSEWSGDFLVARGRRAGYQLAVVVDDHMMGVTEVVRGDDLLASTERQLALYAAMGWKAPAFFHLPLVVGGDGRRLAKRHGDTRLSVLRGRGDGPERVLGWLAKSCGWVNTLREMSLAEIVKITDKCGFSPLPRAATVLTAGDKSYLGFE